MGNESNYTVGTTRTRLAVTLARGYIARCIPDVLRGGLYKCF